VPPQTEQDKARNNPIGRESKEERSVHWGKNRLCQIDTWNATRWAVKKFGKESTTKGVL